MIRNIWIVEDRDLPSTEYYILPAMKILNLIDRIRILNYPPSSFQENQIHLIFVRYVNKDWADFVASNKGKIRRIYYFMDDDLFDVTSWLGLPLRYIKKLFLKAYRWKDWLIKNDAVFLVSNDYLALKYTELNPIILPPYPIFDYKSLESDNPSETQIPHIIFYYGTASHNREKRWIYPIVKEILNRHENVVFEIIADGSVSRLYTGLKRVTVYPPMPWSEYKSFLLSKRRYIGLSPYLDYRFNRARTITKFFEIVACGAVGIYSSIYIYNSVLAGKEIGFSLPNIQDHWVTAISKLLEDSELRLEYFLNSLKVIHYLKESAVNAYRERLGRFEWTEM